MNKASRAAPSWPPPAGVTTPLVPREAVILPVYARTTISAPAAQVWSALLDTSGYAAWNSFCPSVVIDSQPDGISPTDPNLHLGTAFTFNVVMDETKPAKATPTQLRVTDLSTPAQQSAYIPQEELERESAYSSDLGRVYRIAWTTEGGFVTRGLRSERFHEIIPLDREEDGASGSAGGSGSECCEVRTWECQGGILARAVRFYYKDVLQRKFAEWCEDLKREAERRVKEE